MIQKLELVNKKLLTKKKSKLTETILEHGKKKVIAPNLFYEATVTIYRVEKKENDKSVSIMW